MKWQYERFRFRKSTVEMIKKMDSIAEEYMKQGYVLTVRQLYYQLVARGMIENNAKVYQYVVRTVTEARMAGLLDWDAIEDRGRAFRRRTSWTSGTSILTGAAEQYHQDLWAGQPVRPYVVVEKEALAGVLGTICRNLDVPLLAAKGYPSVSVLRSFVLEDFIFATDQGQRVAIFHLGDHDPSGIDMTRDLFVRLDLFAQAHGVPAFQLERIALNMDQVMEVNPPENPAKSTDARFDAYYQKYGESSWELDALDPAYLLNLIRSKIDPLVDQKQRKKVVAEITATKKKLAEFAKQF